MRATLSPAAWGAGAEAVCWTSDDRIILDQTAMDTVVNWWRVILYSKLLQPQIQVRTKRCTSC